MERRLELRGVRKVFGRLVAVDDVSLVVPAGSVTGFLGPNGAGKTTTLRILMDILEPDEGQVLLDGRPRSRRDLAKIGYLPEERGLYRKMSVRDVLVFLGRLHGLTRREALPRIDAWLEKLDLRDRAREKVESMSKGMQQKIQIIGTLLHEPDLLILDEPFSGLDPINQTLFKDLLAEYRAEGRTILFSTHIMEQADKLCDRICLLSRGRVVLQGELREIRRELAGNTWRLVGEGDLDVLADLPGVDQCLAAEGQARLLLEDGADASDVLRAAVAAVRVREFRSEAPDLEEIFVKAVRDAG